MHTHLCKHIRFENRFCFTVFVPPAFPGERHSHMDIHVDVHVDAHEDVHMDIHLDVHVGGPGGAVIRSPPGREGRQPNALFA